MTVGACKRQKIKAIMSERRTNVVCGPVLTKTRILRLDGIGFNFHRFSSEASLDEAAVLSNGSTDMVMYKPNSCYCWCLWKSKFVSSTEKQSKENASQWPRPHLKFQQKIVHNGLQRAPASTPAHPKAAVELLRKSSRPQCRVPRQRDVAKPCQPLRCAAAGRPPRSKESHCSCEPDTRWAGRRAPEAVAIMPQ